MSEKGMAPTTLERRKAEDNSYCECGLPRHDGACWPMSSPEIDRPPLDRFDAEIVENVSGPLIRYAPTQNGWLVRYADVEPVIRRMRELSALWRELAEEARNAHAGRYGVGVSDAREWCADDLDALLPAEKGRT